MGARKKKLTRADKLRRAIAADDDLIAEHAGRGKPLPKWQRQKIEAELGVAVTGVQADSIRDLIAAIGISHPSFIKLRKLRGKPGDKDGKDKSGKYNVDLWRAFAKANLSSQARFLPDVGKIQTDGDSKEGEPPAGDDEGTREGLTVAKLKEELEDIRFKKQVERGEWIKKSDVEEAIRKCNEKFVSELRRTFEQGLPAEYAKHSGNEDICRDINRRGVEEVRTHLHGGDWSKYDLTHE